MASAPPFGVVLPPRPILINPTVISSTQFAFVLPAAPAFSHLAVFLLPGNTLPDGTLAGIYVRFPGSAPDFKLLGALGTGRESAIYKMNEAGSGRREGGGVVEEDMSDLETTATAGEITVGISIESAATIIAQLELLQASDVSALVLSRNQQSASSAISTKILAQRIIKNAFNFLASFAGTTGVGGQEVVPLKSFQDWWTKFERRIENDPGFLEREQDNY